MTNYDRAKAIQEIDRQIRYMYSELGNAKGRYGSCEYYDALHCVYGTGENVLKQISALLRE